MTEVRLYRPGDEIAINDAFKYMGETIHDYIYEDIGEVVSAAVKKSMKAPAMESLLEQLVKEAVTKKARL